MFTAGIFLLFGPNYHFNVRLRRSQMSRQMYIVAWIRIIPPPKLIVVIVGCQLLLLGIIILDRTQKLLVTIVWCGVLWTE